MLKINLKIFLPAIFIAFSFVHPQLKKYEAVEGKEMGIWPHNNRFTSNEKMMELKERWGFNNLLVAAIYGKKEIEMANKNGFPSANVTFQIYLPDLLTDPQKFWNNIGSLGKIGAFYFDEPISREFPYLKLMSIVKELAEKGYYPASQIIMSEINEERALKMINLVDAVSYSGYDNAKEDGTGQVRTWKNWRNFLGEKFSMLWIAAHLNFPYFRTLFKGAKELGVNCIWFYQLEPLPADQEIGDKIFEDFCEAAVEFGYMKYKMD